jgi:hypothetical protein
MLFMRRFHAISLFVLLIAAATLTALPLCAEADRAPVRARISQAVNESSLVTLAGNVHPLARAEFDRGPAPLGMKANRLVLVLSRSAQQEADLRSYLESTQDPNSAEFRQWLTPEEFGQRYGVSSDDLAEVEAWLTSHGFSVNNVAKNRMAIEFSGTVGQVQSAFHTSLHQYAVNGATHWANATNPQIPSALAPVVAGVASLHDFVPRSNAVRGPNGVYNATTGRIEPSYTTGNTTNGYTIFLGPADAATIYDTPTTLNANLKGTAYDGTGVTIGIAGDSNIDVTQNDNYRATFGLAAKATTVVVDGEDPGENGDAIEAYLDTQVATGIAPNSDVILYTAADTSLSAGLFLAINRALDDNQADILNVSFGACEANQGATGNQYVYNLWQQAAAQGISVTVSSGDSGSAGCDNPNSVTSATNGLAVNGLASTPYNIAVGGTDFDTLFSNFPTSFTSYVDVSNTLPNHRSALKYIPEEPWNDSTFQGDNTTIGANVPWWAMQYTSNDNIIAAGGGVSSCSTQAGSSCSAGYSLPSWQSSVATDKTGRNVPDVSLLAGNGLYGATWGLCTDLETTSSGVAVPNCAGTPTTGNNFNLTGVGGTSAAAPAMAGILALIKQKAGVRLGQADYVLYDLAKSKYSTVFHDITVGNNSVFCYHGTPDCAANTGGYYYMTGYNTAVGYDEASGLGSVDASQLLSNWGSAGLTATTSSLTLNGGTTALNITHGASVTVSDTVTGSATGDIALVDNISPATLPNNDSIGSFSLTSGSASGTTNSLPGGSYNVSAHYGGSSTLAQSDSNAIAVTVAPESSTTTLKVAGYYDPMTGLAASNPYYGSIFVVDAEPYGKSASAANPNGAATGTVTFKSGTATLGTATLDSNGVAELQTAMLPGGSDSLTASFPGDASFQANTSAPVTFAVIPAPTTLQSPSFSTQSITAGNPVTLTTYLVNATKGQYLDSMGVAPTGTVTFQSGATILGTAPVTGTAATSTSLATGSVALTTTLLPAGVGNLVTASYSGDTNYAASTSTASSFYYVQSVAAPIKLVASSSTITINQPLQVTVTTSSVSGLPTPTGTITLSAQGTNAFGGYTLPAVSLVNGSATMTIPANTLVAQPTTLIADYSGDLYYGGGNATTVVQVNPIGTVSPTVTVISPAGPVSPQLFSASVTVTGPSGDPVPTGMVTLTNPNVSSWAEPLVNGTATFNFYPQSIPDGPNTFTATYFGDTSYTSGIATGIITILGTDVVTISPSTSSMVVNQPLNLTVTVTSDANVPAPTGTVTLSAWNIDGSGAYNPAPVALVGGVASFAIPANSLPVGNDEISVLYNGDTSHLSGGAGENVTVTAALAPSFTIAGTAVTLAHGATTANTSTITVTPSGGFTGNVTLTAAIATSPTGAQDLPTFSFGSTSPVSITGTTAETATLTITTTAATTSAFVAPKHNGAPWYAAGGVTLACLLLFGIPGRRRNWQTLVGMLLLLVAISGGVMACGGGGSGSTTSSGGGGSTGGTSNPGTTTGSYTVTVTATSGTVQATTNLQLTVN